ncbi:hypothetical protein [Corynebacterium diphtheriae]|uniref:hypothetical protein n=1 Tax=Corynebacterium diphtheriae TaxID=1717 RepID=UPI0018CAD417|nr:hypothetical protein [Corynebacterium diphtheriae]MBG9355901.1 hypothetical protein [Corynebacterium diphtheriae bv. mitis]
MPINLVKASETARTVEGIVVPWEQEGKTSTGSLIFPKDTLDHPAELERVKLLAGHSPAGIPVGHAIAAESRDEGLWMKFQLGSSDDATDALVKASEHVVDAFSIEAVGLKRQGYRATSALLKAVALVPFPAFAEARVTETHAEDHDETVSDNTTIEEAADEENDGTDQDQEAEANMKPKKNPLRPAITPAGIQTTSKEVHASLDDALGVLVAAHNGEMSMDEVHAELKDIVGSSTLVNNPPQWLGEVWAGVAYQRRIVPLVQNKPLRGRKAVGFQWKTKPTVAKWAGDKKDIPSTAAAWQEVTAKAQPWAGGNDLDRQMWDFGEIETIKAYWAAMAESYAYETDKELGAFLTRQSTDIGESAPDLIRAISRGALAVDKTVHIPASFAIVNPGDLQTVLDFSQLDVPHYTNLTPVSDPAKWVTSEFVEKGTAIVGAKQAATFFELAGSPLRVEAEHIAKGGKDAALFGYTATLINRKEALVKVHFEKTKPLRTA